MGRTQGSAPGSTIDESQLIEVTRRLRSLLPDMDSYAADWATAHAALLAAAYPAHFQAIERALEGFDFDVSSAQLDAAVAVRRAAA